VNVLGGCVGLATALRTTQSRAASVSNESDDFGMCVCVCGVSSVFGTLCGCVECAEFPHTLSASSHEDFSMGSV
jgi:hypothetical protein